MLAYLFWLTFPLPPFPSLFLMLRPFVLPNKDTAAQSKHLCSLGLCKCTLHIYNRGFWAAHQRSTFAPEHGVALSHFNQVHSLSRPVPLCRWVQIACPRLSIDWGTAFSKPLLSPYEVHASYIQHLSLLKQRERSHYTCHLDLTRHSIAEVIYASNKSEFHFPKGKIGLPC